VALSEDVTREVFLDVWRCAGRFEGRSTVSTWILAIARHKASSARPRLDQVQFDEGLVEAIEDVRHGSRRELANGGSHVPTDVPGRALSITHLNLIPRYHFLPYSDYIDVYGQDVDAQTVPVGWCGTRLSFGHIE
jgi:hypothetical protein